MPRFLTRPGLKHFTGSARVVEGGNWSFAAGRVRIHPPLQHYRHSTQRRYSETARPISKQHILKYEEVVKAGKFLVIAHGSAEDVRRSKEILSGTGAAELTAHSSAA
jgi:hypothetical protein